MADYQPAGGNLGEPPLHFRRRPPQSNCPPDNVRFYPLKALVTRYNKGGISTTARHKLASMLQSLPPILHIPYQITMSSCSKGSRGLSVRSRVGGIFIRAGRNLPDKEFRYLRTVIVTAAVYRGFNSELRIS